MYPLVFLFLIIQTSNSWISQFNSCTDYYLISVEYLFGYVLWSIVFCDKMKTLLFVTYLFFLKYIWCMSLLNCYLTIENVNKTDLSFSQVRYTSFLYSEKLVWWVMNDLQVRIIILFFYYNLMFTIVDNNFILTCCFQGGAI